MFAFLTFPKDVIFELSHSKTVKARERQITIDGVSRNEARSKLNECNHLEWSLD